MYLAYSESEKRELIVESEKNGEAVCSDLEGEEGVKIFLPLSDLRKTGKLQKNDKSITEKLQGDYSEITEQRPLNYNEITRIKKARKSLPTPPSLKQEVSLRWQLLVILSKDESYKSSSIQSFSEMIQKLQSGEIKGVPRPVCKAVNRAADLNVSIPYLNRTVELYIQYAKQRPPRWLVAIDRALESVDKLLNLIIFKVIL